VLVQVGISRQRFAVRAWLTFAGANHSCLTDMLTRDLLLLPAWSITAGCTANSTLVWQCLMRIGKSSVVKSNGGFGIWLRDEDE
jgi:hypothetical protein